MKKNFTGLISILLFVYSFGFAQEFDSLIVAPEIKFKGQTPDGVFFKPGRILDENTIWLCGNYGDIFEGNQVYVWRSVDGGVSFTHNEDGIPGRAAQMDAFDENIAIVATAEGYIYRTTDGGATWDSVYSYVISPTVDGWFDGCRVLNDSVAVVYGDFEPNGNMHFVRSTDRGATWTEIEGIDYLGAAYGYYTWGTAACNVGESIWCSATNTNYDSSFVFRSYDAGVTWDSYKIPVEVIPNYPRSIAFSDDNNGLIAARGGYLIKSTDGGATWSATFNPDTTAGSNSYPNSVVAIPNTDIIIALDDIGVFYTADLGTTWGQISTPAETESDYIVSGMFLNTNMGYIFTDNGLVLRFASQVPTAIREPFLAKNPNDFQLYQNYPNPFNPSTQITFFLPHAAEVKIVIYDLQGRKVRTLLDGYRTAGTHNLTWAGTNDTGKNVASGVYIYKMTTNGFSTQKKMQLIR